MRRPAASPRLQKRHACEERFLQNFTARSPQRLAQSMPRRWISRASGTSKSRATWPSDE